MKNAEKFLLEITTKNISENKSHKLYNNLIKSDISAWNNQQVRVKIREITF